MKRFYEQINETRENMAADCMKTYDQFLEQCLEPYGINMVNARENAYRVFIQEVPPTELGLPTYKRFYIDGVYAFTVAEKQSMDFESGTIFNLEYYKILEQDCLPMTDEEAIIILAELAEKCVVDGKEKRFKALSKALSVLNERVSPKKVSADPPKSGRYSWNVGEEPDKHETKAPDWIYRDIPKTQCNINFEEIEQALGFKLFYWQKTYIAYGFFRQYGCTTSNILRELINPELTDTPIDYSRRATNMSDDFYRRILIEIKEKLDKAGVKTRKVKLPSGKLI